MSDSKNGFVSSILQIIGIYVVAVTILAIIYVIFGTHVDPVTRYIFFGTIAAVVIFGFWWKILDNRRKKGLSYGYNFIELGLAMIFVAIVVFIGGGFLVAFALEVREVSDLDLKTAMTKWGIVSLLTGMLMAVYRKLLDREELAASERTGRKIYLHVEWRWIVVGCIVMGVCAFLFDGWVYIFIPFVGIIYFLNEDLKRNYSRL